MPYQVYNEQRIERYHKGREAEAQRVGKVVRFLRNNPLSTAEEVWAATGVSVLAAKKYVRQKKYEGKIVWRLNHPKLKEHGLL